MKAILLAAGFGKRLRPITETIPKCLVTIKGVPLLEIWLEKLTKVGVTEIYINTHYLHEKVENFILNSRFKDIVTLGYEKKLRGTAGTLLDNIDFFENEDGFLIHADNLCDENILNFIKCHKKRPEYCEITMLVFETEEPQNCGIVSINKDNVVDNFYEKVKNPPGNLANGAIYLLSKKFLANYKQNFKIASDFSNEVLPKMLNKIFVYKSRCRFLDIGTNKNYTLANT